MHYKEIQYGFEYGAAELTRLFSDEKEGWCVMCLRTPKTRKKYKNGCFQLYVTKTGKVRIFGPDGKEWKAPCSNT